MDYNAAGLNIEGSTEFTGYEHIDGHETIRTVIVGGEEKAAQAGDEAILVLERTPFYAESGGQVGDTGLLTWSGGRFKVTDTQKEGSNHLHIGTVIEGELFPGLEVDARIDHARRERTKKNHSATHLMHAALRNVLGEHVTQKGSLVDPDKLRFDFSHFESVTPEQLREIERQVNEQILGNTPVETEITDMEQAQAKGAMALFGEKYGDTVRVLSMGSDAYSVELCGGTHVARTGDIGLFRITSESGISSGVRRIEAVTGFGALEWVEETEQTCGKLQSWSKARVSPWSRKFSRRWIAIDSWRRTSMLSRRSWQALLVAIWPVLPWMWLALKWWPLKWKARIAKR